MTLLLIETFLNVTDFINNCHNSLPDVHTGQEGKETATETGEGNRTQRCQAAVTPQPHGLEGNAAVHPHAVVAVCGHGLRQNITKLYLVSQ